MKEFSRKINLIKAEQINFEINPFTTFIEIPL